MKDERKDTSAEVTDALRDIVKKSFISDEELNEYSREEIERVKQIILEKSASEPSEPDEPGEEKDEGDPVWIPQVCFVSRKEETANNRDCGLCVIGELPQLHGEKVQVLREVGRQAGKYKEIDCVAAFFSSEVWYRKPVPGEIDGLKKAPSECDDRQEGLLVNGCTIDGRNTTRMRGIVREGGRKDGRIIDLVDIGMDIPYSKANDSKIDSPLMRAFFQGYLMERVSTGPFKDVINDAMLNDEAKKDDRWAKWSPPRN